jgi:hypothetical protein
MTDKTIYNNPTITDAIIFDILCPDTSGCFSANPWAVDKVTIYYIERDFLGQNYGEYEREIYNDDLEDRFIAAQKTACDNPTAENIAAAEQLKVELDSTAQKTTYYYKDRMPVQVIGTTDFPAWLSTDINNAFIELVPIDVDGNAQCGHYQYRWEPQGSVREGDYFICWSWRMIPTDSPIAAHMPFHLDGDPKIVQTVPSHIAPAEKYDVLLERYTPEMFKFQLSDDDLTPLVTNYLNNAIADGFTFIENMANQIIDLFDANVLHESLLMYLANLFNLKLKSNDPTLWRRQIKEAIPLFKEKGTLHGLEGAFEQAGMRLDKLTQLWQIVSQYVWQESFRIKSDDTFKWPLSKNNIVLPIDSDYFGLWLRTGDTEESISADNVEFSEEYGIVYMTWIGDPLTTGDIVRLKYQYKAFPSGSQGDTAKTLEAYLQTNCPLADARDELTCDYPPKNWNVRVVEEDDPLFSVLIPVRHPYHDWIVFGKVRTEFPYSENIYNMEEYNGSTRDSYDACYIDKDFVDPCGSCLGSLFNIDVATDELSDDRIMEINDVLREYTPFHAQVHTLRLSGEFNEFVQSSVETIVTLISMSNVDCVISGENNPFFHRAMHDGLTTWAVYRDDLATRSVVDTGTGTAYNRSIKLIAPNDTLRGVSVDHHILEVLPNSTNAGTYQIGEPDNHIAEIVSVVGEPFDQSLFTFKLSNILYSTVNADIIQSNLFQFSDIDGGFESLDIQTVADGNAWKVTIGSHTYDILQVLPNGVLVVQDDGTLSAGTGLSYTLYTYDDQEIQIGQGDVIVQVRALVDLNDNELVNVNEFIQINDFVYYDGDEYRIIGFDGVNPYIDDYSDGDAVGVTISTRRRVLDNAIGYFAYSGLYLETAENYETSLGIVNGANATAVDGFADDDNFMENYMVQITIDDTDYYYKIEAWNNQEITISGLDQNWGLSGTTVDYSIVHFEKQSAESQGMTFDIIDRRGKDPVVREISTDTGTTITALSQNPNSGLQEHVSQQEGVTWEITYSNGETEQGGV